MRIALLGSAPSSVRLAPLKNGRYQEWAQGRYEPAATAHGQVEGDWEIWGCSPGAWSVTPRATRWFEVHRWEPGQAWFSPEYCQFLRNFRGPVYTGATIPEIQNHVVYPIDRMEEKFASYFFTSSLALMCALAIDTIEQVREARAALREAQARNTLLSKTLPQGVPSSELDKDDSDDVIGMWGVDMSANEEYAYQRPGCQFFLIEAMRRGIGVFLPPESDLMRPMPVYGISEWDHNYIKLTARARELNQRAQSYQQQMQEAQTTLQAIQGEMGALNNFVNTWTSPYGMLPGMIIRQEKGTGLGSGITTFDGRPIERMVTRQTEVVRAFAEPAVDAVSNSQRTVSMAGPPSGDSSTALLSS
jgi:hypothetical protein